MVSTYSLFTRNKSTIQSMIFKELFRSNIKLDIYQQTTGHSYQYVTSLFINCFYLTNSFQFYAVMCAIYIIYAIVWFTCSACYYRDVIRVQFWIGGVILLGMIEKAAYLAEYESMNRNGDPIHFGIIFAEFVSCLKRSLARMLVIIVSLGFGIVK